MRTPAGSVDARLPRGSRRWGTALAVAALSLLGLAGCAAPPHQTPTSAPRAHTSAAAVGTRPGSTASYCQVPLPSPWATALGPATGPAVDGLSSEFAPAPTGDSYFATSYSDTWSGIVQVQQATGRVQQIYRFPDTGTLVQAAQSGRMEQVETPLFDGRWLAWAERYSLQDLAPTSVMAVDTETGRSVEVYSLPEAASDTSIASVTVAGLSQGPLLWEVLNGGTAAIHLTDLTTGQDRTVVQIADNEGDSAPALFGDQILLAQGRSRELAGYSLETGQEVALPAGLSQARDVEDLAAGAGEVEWVSGTAGPGPATTWIWRSGQDRPSEVGVVRDGTSLSLSVDGVPGVVSVLPNSDAIWWSGSREWLVDPAQHTMAPLTRPVTQGTLWYLTDWALVGEDGPQLLFAEGPPPASKVDTPPISTTILDTSSLPPLPACPS